MPEDLPYSRLVYKGVARVFRGLKLGQVCRQGTLHFVKQWPKIATCPISLSSSTIGGPSNNSINALFRKFAKVCEGPQSTSFAI